ncbi:MAG: fused MFS/spermidine synthase [Thermoleophilaceae bacterium]|nr:fused MFS/spermidine synthase [Thermoleophilaceae bacterium]
MTEPAPRPPRPPLSLLVFVVGAAALGIEIAAVRLLAPYFGASEVVWANTIGVVLVALSVGYWLGGRIGDRRPHMADLCAAVMIGAALTAALPFVARPLLDVGVEALDSVSAGAFVGSLLATLLLLAVPVLVLGTVAPWALRIGIEQVDKLDAGKLAGRLYALGTAGSLVGTLLCALVLVPGIGTRRTFLLFALTLALVGLIGVARRPRWAVLPVVIAVLFVIPQSAIKPSSTAGKVIFEDESASQYLRVIEGASGSRTLELNEGQSRHSFYQPTTVLTNDYWDAALVLPLATTAKPPARVAILGNAAGTTARAFAEFFPETQVDGVDIDGELAGVGRSYFGLKDKNFTAHTADARPYLRATDKRYDALILDAYRQPYIPFYLTTREFFALARDRLRHNGTVVVNVGHPVGSEVLERVLAATMAEEFQHVWIDHTRPTNSMLVASDSPVQPALVVRGTAGIPELAPTGRREASRLMMAPTDGDVYIDDRAPVEWLIDRSIVQYAAGE